MPPLTNQRHELFVQHLIAGTRFGSSQGSAYIKAGYNATPAAADVGACRLLKKAKIKARLAELTAPTVRKTKTTVDALAEQFDAVFEGAMGSAQFGAAGTAAGLKAKLLGFMRERLELGGPGSFDTCGSLREIASKMLEDTGMRAAQLIEGLDMLRNELVSLAEAMMIDVTPPEHTTFYERAEANAKMYAEIRRKS